MENQNSNLEVHSSANIENGNFTDFVQASTNLETLKPVITLSADYIELEKPGEKFRGIYIGTQIMNVADKLTGELKEIKAVRFLINKAVKINGGVVLVNEIERSGIRPGTPVEVTYSKKEGNTKIYALTLLG
jgi:hypothetical protein